MAQTSRSEFLGMKNPMAHYIPLWVLVLFTFLVVCICTMGGLQEGLGKRQFSDTEVSGDLTVEGDTVNPTGEIGCNNFVPITADAAFTAQYNRTYLITATITASRVITLPSPVTTAGTVIKFILGADLANTFDWTIGQGTALGALAFATGSYNIVADVADEGRKGTTLAAAANNTLTIAGDTNGGGGVGSKVVLTSTGSNWFVEADLVPNGNGSVNDSSAFSTVA